MDYLREDRRARLKLLASVVVLIALLTPAVARLMRSPERPPEPGEVVLHYAAWGNPQQLQVERQVCRLFNEKCAREGKRIRVELFMPPAGGYAQKMRLMLASNSAPDVMRIDHYDFPSLVVKGCFADLTDLAKNDPDFDASDFHPSAMRENVYNGRLYGLNVLFGGVVCYYNKDLFARALLPDPYDQWKKGQWDWDAFEHAALELTIRENARVKQYGFLMPAAGQGSTPSWSWFVWVWNAGGQILTDGRCTFDSPQAIAGMQRFRDLRYVLRCSPTPADSQASAFTFESGNIAMVFSFAGDSPRYRDAIKDFSWDIVPTPSQQGRPVQLVKGNQLVIWSGSPHPREAWEWVKFMTSVEIEEFLSGDQRRREVPTRRSVLNAPEYLKATRPPFHTDVFPYLLDNARELPIDGAWPVFNDEAQKFIDDLFVDETATARDILPRAASSIDQSMRRERQRLAQYQSSAESGEVSRGR